MNTETASFESLRAAVMADAALQKRLAAHDDASAFAADAAAAGRERGLALDPAVISNATANDPAGMALLRPSPANATRRPSPSWLPVHVATQGSPTIDFAYFGNVHGTLDQLSLRRAMERPFNRAFRVRLRLEDFVADAETANVASPCGFLFHMSRTGSTLVAQMLGALPDRLTLSELPPMSDAILIAAGAPRLTDMQRSALLRAVLTAYGGQAIVHFDAWNTLVLPLIRRTFPGLPFAFLYRDAVEVLVSHRRLGGMQIFSAALPRLWNIDGFERMDEDELTARALGKICTCAADAIAGGGLAIGYRELPGAVETKLLPHFGIAADPSVYDSMRRIAAMDAKSPAAMFSDDHADKQREADAKLRALAETHIAPACRRLETLA